MYRLEQYSIIYIGAYRKKRAWIYFKARARCVLYGSFYKESI